VCNTALKCILTDESPLLVVKVVGLAEPLDLCWCR
jgi:hypothetical protein